MYSASKKLLETKNLANRPLEYKLFHGTSKESIDSICKSGFNRSFCGLNGVSYGQGVYFALHASYSHTYSSKNKNCNNNSTSTKDISAPQTYQMLLAKVLVGNYQHKNYCSNLKDTEFSNKGFQYDSVVNYYDRPTIFVIFKDYRALPEYLIEYTKMSRF